MRERIDQFLFGSADAVRLDTFQRLVTVTLLAYIVERSTHALEWLSAEGFHYSLDAHDYWMPTPPPLLPVPLVGVFLALFFGAILWAIFARRTRVAIWMILGCTVYVTFLDPPSAFTLNRLYIVLYCVLAFAPASRGTHSGGSRHSVWPIRVLQTTLLMQYFTAGFCKLIDGDWLQEPNTVWSQSQGHFMNDLCYWMLHNLPIESFTVMQYASLSFELCSPLLFLIRPLRPLGILWGIGFHMGIAFTMHKLIYFSAQMMCFYVLFVDERLLHRARSVMGKQMARLRSSLLRHP